MKEYVIALATRIPSHDTQYVLLVERVKQDWQFGRLNLPGGGIEGDEPPEVAGCRELEEETGYKAWELRELTSGPPSAGMSSEVVTFLLATKLERKSAGGGDHSETIEVHKVPLADVPRWLEKRREHGTLVDPKVYAGLYFAERAVRAIR